MPLVAAIFLAAGAIFAAIYGAACCWRPSSWPRTAVKTASVAALVPASAVLGAPLAITLGLLLGAAGDFFLSRPGERAFLAGMAAFGAGHLAYAWVFWASGSTVAVIPVAALVLIALSTEVWLAPHTGALLWPVRAYVALIALMALAALALGPVHRLAPIGAGLFVFSDLMLAIERFVTTDPRLGRALSHLLWAAYWSGQALILWGMAAGAAS